MLIDHSQVIVTSLRDHTIDEIVGTTAQLPSYMSKLALSLIGTSYRYEYGSLLAYRAEKEKGLQIIHIQGENAQTNDPSGRRSDTRIVYNIEPSELRKAEYKLGSVLNSLPFLEPFYENKLLGQLPNTLDIKEPIPVSKQEESLRQHMVSAIIDRKRLLVKLDTEDIFWQGNELFSNDITQTIFAALDNLPYEFRQIASIGLSIDDKFRQFLNNCQFIFYQGELSTDNFGFKDITHISWSELQSCTPIVSESEMRYYRMYCRILAKQYGNEEDIDLYYTEMSSREMFIGIHEIRRNIEEFENLLRFSVEKKAANIQRLFCEELLTDMTTYPLGLINSIVYSILKDNLYTDAYKKELLQKYNREYRNVDHMFGQSVDELLMKDIAQIEASNDYSLSSLYSDYTYLPPEDIMERFMQYLAEQNKFMIIHKATAKLGETENLTTEMKDFFFGKIIEQLQSKSATIQVGQFVSIARSVSSEEQRKMLANYLSNRDDIRIFEELFTSKDFETIRDVVLQGFNRWKGWNVEEKKLDRAICRSPFLEHLTPEQLLLTRRVRLPEWNSYRELYSDIEYSDIAEIFELSTNHLQTLNYLINLMTDVQKEQFVNDNLDTLLEIFEVMLYQMDDVTKTSVWQLLRLRNDLHFTIDFKSGTLIKIISNLQRLQQERVQLDYSAAALYQSCESLDEIKDTYTFVLEKAKLLNLEPDSNTLKAIHQRFSDNVEEYFSFLIWLFRKGVTIPDELSAPLVGLLNNVKNYNELNAGFELILMLNTSYSQDEFSAVLQRLEAQERDEEARRRLELYLTSNHLTKWKKTFDEANNIQVETTPSAEKIAPELLPNVFAEPSVETVTDKAPEVVSIEESVREESLSTDQTIDDTSIQETQEEAKIIEAGKHDYEPQRNTNTLYKPLFYISLCINILLLATVIWFVIK